MGKGDKKSKKGKIISGSYGNKRPRKMSSVANIPVKVLDEDDTKSSKAKVRKEVGHPTEKTENADVEKKPKAAAKPKAEKAETEKVAKPKADKPTEDKDSKSKAENSSEEKEAKPKKTEE